MGRGCWLCRYIMRCREVPHGFSCKTPASLLPTQHGRVKSYLMGGLWSLLKEAQEGRELSSSPHSQAMGGLDTQRTYPRVTDLCACLRQEQMPDMKP